jgi:opacity protein-like surface antigen
MKSVVCVAGILTITAFAVEPSQAQILTGPLYIRGDVGWSGSTGANVHDRNFPADHVIKGPNGFAGDFDDIGSGWLAGIGVGTQFLPGIRADLVYTYRGDYELDENDHAAQSTHFKANLHSSSVMANGYADFPFDPNISGFVGLGIGWANVNVGDFRATGNLAVNQPGPTPPFTANFPGGSQDNFAWQAMAGLTFTIPAGPAIDVFYRWFDGGHFQTDAGNVLVNGTAVRTYQGAEGALHANEVVLSVRFPLS